MHPYSTSSEERARVLLVIAGAAFGLAWVVATLIGMAHVPFWLDVPATGTLYGILYKVFERWGWKRELFHRLNIVSVPNLAGDWQGSVSSSFDKYAETHPVTIHIAQNWTHISIALSSEKSDSHSIVASIDTGTEAILSYQYQNTPKPHARGTMHAHRGTAVLKLASDGKRLSGEYYSGRDRQNYGALELTKASE
jgi:hypothetical protein